MSLADRLKHIRGELRRETQKEMAKAISVSVQMLQAYEAGKSVPGGNVLEALARLGFNVNWLLLGIGPKKLHEEEVRRLCCEEAHEKLKIRIRSFVGTPARLHNVEGFSYEQIQAYLKGDYLPNYNQLINLCNRADAAFRDKEFVDVITSVDLISTQIEPQKLSESAQEIAFLIDQYAGRQLIDEIKEKLLKVKAAIESER